MKRAIFHSIADLPGKAFPVVIAAPVHNGGQRAPGNTGGV